MGAEDLYEFGHNHVAWNFGSNSSYIVTVSDLAKLFAGKWGIDMIIEEKDSLNSFEANMLGLDSSKAFPKLNWRPIWSVEVAIKETAEWFPAYKKNVDVLGKLNQQIQEYTSSIPAW